MLHQKIIFLAVIMVVGSRAFRQAERSKGADIFWNIVHGKSR